MGIDTTARMDCPNCSCVANLSGIVVCGTTCVCWVIVEPVVVGVVDALVLPELTVLVGAGGTGGGTVLTCTSFTKYKNQTGITFNASMNGFTNRLI